MRVGSFFISLLLLVFCSCGEKEKTLVVESRTLKTEAATPPHTPSEFSSRGSEALGHNFWVEGELRNRGNTDIKNAIVIFHGSNDSEATVLIAQVNLVPAGQTAWFKTPVLPSKTEVKLDDEDPEILYGER